MKMKLMQLVSLACMTIAVPSAWAGHERVPDEDNAFGEKEEHGEKRHGHSHHDAEEKEISHGKHLFERETFGGNGRTCLSCHSLSTGTVSPEDAQQRFI